MKKLVYLLFLAAISSCSVKEDRGECPCTLYLHACNELPDGDVFICASRGNEVLGQGMVSVQDVISGKASLTVPRGACTVCMFSGVYEMSVSGDGCLAIIPGNGCDRIWSYSENVEVGGEIFHHAGTLHKNHAELTLAFSGLTANSAIVVSGNVNGYRNSDMKPMEGTFVCAPEQRNDGAEYRLCLPRQTDDSLSLSVREGDFEIRNISIGEMLSRIGYDWKADDLLDIRLTVNLSKSKIDITVSDWNPVEYDIVEI